MITCKQLLSDSFFSDTLDLVAGSVDDEKMITWFFLESNPSKQSDLQPGGGELVFVLQDFINMESSEQISYLEKCIHLHTAGLVISGNAGTRKWNRQFLEYADYMKYPVFRMRIVKVKKHWNFQGKPTFCRSAVHLMSLVSCILYPGCRQKQKRN